MADVKWIKITTDMFDNRKIRHLRRLPEGNNIVLLWVMLLTMAGRCNASGMIFLTENIPYTPKMLADELDFEENTVMLGLKCLEELNMVCTDNGFFTIAGWEEYQNIDGMAKLKEQTRQRVAKHREKKRLLEGNVTGNVTVTQSNATDIEEEKEEDKEKEKEKKTKPEKRKYGEFKHVRLTDTEFENLENEYGTEMRYQAIKFLDEYIEEKEYKSKSHYLAIRRWVIDAVRENAKKQGAVKQPKQTATDDFMAQLQSMYEG